MERVASCYPQQPSLSSATATKHSHDLTIIDQLLNGLLLNGMVTSCYECNWYTCLSAEDQTQLRLGLGASCDRSCLGTNNGCGYQRRPTIMVNTINHDSVHKNRVLLSTTQLLLKIWKHDYSVQFLHSLRTTGKQKG